MLTSRTAAFVAVFVLGGLSATASLGLDVTRPRSTEFRFPDHDHVWRPEDYLAIDSILRSSSPTEFPRLQSTRWGGVFEKMIDAGDVVAAAHDPSVPLLRRLIDLRCYDGFIGSYRARYNVAVRGGARLQPELVRLQQVLLELSALTVELTEPFAASLDAPQRQQLADMRFFDTYATLKNHLLGVVTSLSEREIYSVAQRIELAGTLHRHVGVLRPTLSSTDQSDLSAELSRLAWEAGDPVLRTILTGTASLVAAGP